MFIDLKGEKNIKKVKCILLVGLIFFVKNVFASSYYENNNGVAFTKCEYDYITNLFYSGFQNNMLQNDFDAIFDKVSCNSAIYKNTLFEIAPHGNTHVTKSKNLSIKKSCGSSNCNIVIQLNWLVTPKNRSYDVIGAYLENTNFTSQSILTYINGVNITNESTFKYYLNGYGTSFLLSSDDKPIIVQYFNVKNKGTVYASYQHSIKQISLAISQKYSLSRSGYGGVFLFENNINQYFDGMAGVSV